MKRIAFVACLVLLLTSVLMGAEDLSGKWSGSFIMTSPDGEKKDDLIYAVLKQSGTELTGTAGPNSNEQWAILKGKIDGNKVTFEVQTPEPLIKFELALIDGHLKGQAKGDHGGQSMKADVDMQRKTD